MLRDTFFIVKAVSDIGESRIYRVALNASHPIFQAHFAGSPVMPGACIVQMIKELVSDYSSAPFFISAVKNMKFLKVITPLENPEISVQITCMPEDNENLLVSSVIHDGDSVFSKATLILNPVK